MDGNKKETFHHYDYLIHSFAKMFELWKEIGMKIKAITLFCVLICMAALNGCKKTPENDYIRQQKDIKSVVKDNDNTEQSEAIGTTEKENASEKKKLKDLLKAPEKEECELKSEDGKTKITVNASINIPDVSKISAYEMIRNDYTNDMLKSFQNVFFGDEKVWHEGTPNDDKIEYNMNHSKKGFVVEGKADNTTAVLYVNTDTGFSELGYYKDVKADYMPFTLPKDAVINNKCKYSLEEAKNIAQKYIDKLDKSGAYTLASILYRTDKISFENGEPVNKNGKNYDTYGYKLVYKRCVDSVIETYDSTCLKADPETALIPYNYETMEITISNDGLVNFVWDSPMKVGNVLAKDLHLLSYSEILGIFKKQVLINYADPTTSIITDGDIAMGPTKDQAKSKKNTFEATVSNITLGYMRVTNKGSKGYTLIPVWDFISENSGQSLLTINAVDGSLIDRSLGY